MSIAAIFILLGRPGIPSTGHERRHAPANAPLISRQPMLVFLRTAVGELLLRRVKCRQHLTGQQDMPSNIVVTAFRNFTG